MDNFELSERDFDFAREECQRLIFRLYDMQDMGDCAVRWAECMECDRLSPALWIVGDFLLCHRCCARRFAVRARLEREGYLSR